MLWVHTDGLLFNPKYKGWLVLCQLPSVVPAFMLSLQIASGKNNDDESVPRYPGLKMICLQLRFTSFKDLNDSLIFLPTLKFQHIYSQIQKGLETKISELPH